MGARYHIKVKILGDYARPEWAPGKPIDPDNPTGLYIGVSHWVREWCDELKRWVKVTNRWSERVR